MNNLQTYEQYLNEGWFSSSKDDDIADKIISKIEKHFDENMILIDNYKTKVYVLKKAEKKRSGSIW